MRMIDTTKGPIPEDQLEVKEIRTSGENDESIAREWYLAGELVRRDAWVTLLHGQSVTGEQGNFNHG